MAANNAALTAAGFEDALKGALRAADVPGTDETPAPLTTAAASAGDCGNPHVCTVRTMRAYTGGGPDLIWYGAAGNRTKLAITGFGILDGYRGVLVRDDYGGYLSYDAGLAAWFNWLATLAERRHAVPAALGIQMPTCPAAAVSGRAPASPASPLPTGP